jgi:acid phosphatase type 7
MQKRLLAILAAVVCLCGCSGSPAAPAQVPGGGGEGPPSVSAAAPVTFAGAGDIADCGAAAPLTAALLDRIDGTIFTLGDHAYPSGTSSEFRNCYEPTWGRHRQRTRPTPGNHDYNTGGGAPYFEYFGTNAGPAGLGYYSFTLGAWHVVSLNSEIDARAGSPQERWLRADLAANPAKCTVAYWHRALFSSGNHGGDPKMSDIWRTLYEHDVDLAITGHEHLYERFAPQDASGRLDTGRGIRQFVVGTGGVPLFPLRQVRPNSELSATVHGVIAFTLETDRYRWRFTSIDGSFGDTGMDSCH